MKLMKSKNIYTIARIVTFKDELQASNNPEYAIKNENGEISVIDTKTLEEEYVLYGHKQTIIKIDFHTADELITADEANKLMYWRLE